MAPNVLKSVYAYVPLPMFIFFRTWETDDRKFPALRMADHTTIVLPVFEPQIEASVTLDIHPG